MKAAVLTAVATAAALSAAALPASAASTDAVALRPVVRAASGAAVPGQYIVTLKPGVSARAAATSLGVAPLHVYDSAVHGYAARLTAAQLLRVQRDPSVAMIEEDQVARIAEEAGAADVQPTDLYGLDRIDQRRLPLSGTYSFNTKAAGVHVYVIDTGIAPGHPQFGGRANKVYDAFGGTGQDCHGHGTHVAGTVGGATFGVAKRVRLHGVRVLDCSASGSVSGIIAGINWVRTHQIRPAVANLSLRAGYSQTLNNATANLAGSGVAVAVAAGNDGIAACKVSPASTANVITVGAVDRSDTRPYWSNFGTCVDVFAPGVNIMSTIPGGTAVFSGTSMASPHVAGVMALYKAKNGNVGTAKVNSWIKDTATTGLVKAPNGSPNKLLFKATL
ncbi:MAG: S8 family peptidase [Actinomycetota bacterium]|nr:S8 family peptidase [Actinomycetota bacterium]